MIRIASLNVENLVRPIPKGIVFSRDCAEYEVRTPSGAVIQILVNHFKSLEAAERSANDRQKPFVRLLMNSFREARMLLLWEI